MLIAHHARHPCSLDRVAVDEALIDGAVHRADEELMTLADRLDVGARVLPGVFRGRYRTRTDDLFRVKECRGTYSTLRNPSFPVIPVVGTDARSFVMSPDHSRSCGIGGRFVGGRLVGGVCCIDRDT